VYASRFLSADLCIRYSSGEVICYEGTINRSITTIDYGSSHAMGNFDDFTHGTTHQCGVKDGAVTCFDGYGAPSSAAATVPTGLGRIVDIESFVGSTCALDDEGNVTCWGSLAAPAMPPIRELVSGGLGSYCAIDVNGGLHCWGGVSTVPEGLDRVEHVAVSNSFACAVRETREIVCWGNSAATIIDNAPAYSPVGVVDIALTGGHLSTACILDEAGRVGCWGHPAMLGTAIDLN
jgi:hypothetical protein